MTELSPTARLCKRHAKLVRLHTVSRKGKKSRRRDCHFDDTPFLSLLKHLLNIEGGTAE